MENTGQGVKGYSKSNDIRKDGQVGSITMGKGSKRDAYLMEKYANEKEQYIQKQ